MNKLRLPLFLLASAFIAIIIQSCNKDTVTSIAYTTAAFQANIDGSAWAPDTLSTAIFYNQTTKVKTFNCIGTKNAKQVIFTIKLPNSGDTPGFTIGTYNIDSLNVTAQYLTQQQNSSGQYVFLPHGTVGAGSGSIVISAVDSVKKQITGTFFLSVFASTVAYT